MTAPTRFLGKLRPEIKNKWLEALRSGGYEQTNGYLHRGGGFCCLGVLCDLAEKAGVTDSRLSGDPDEDGAIAYAGAATMPPAEVRDWAFEEHPALGEVWAVTETRVVDGVDIVHTNNLSEFNDEFGYTFAQIADLIEASL